MPPALARYKSWIVDEALPRWATDGFDLARDCFRERLDFTARPIDVPHRAMVQGRQIYVFSHAARLGWHAEGGALAERAAASLIRDFCNEGPTRASFAFSIGFGGAVVSPLRDAYAHAFQLLALASLYMMNGDRRLIALADKIVAFMDDEMLDPNHGGLFDAAPALDLSKRQNPVMHLLEAYLFLERAAPDRGYLKRAVDLVRLMQRRFLHPESGVLLEYFDRDWGAHPDEGRSAMLEPGHHFEWVWLLGEYDVMSGEDHSGTVAHLYRTAWEHGVTADGLIRDELDTSFRVIKPSHRVWPHTEAIKAAVAMRRIDRQSAKLADDMATTLLDHFLAAPFVGGWIDHLDPDLRPLVDYVPASTLYHLFLAASEACATDIFADATTPIAG